jgi:small GTP-binding protein
MLSRAVEELRAKALNLLSRTETISSALPDSDRAAEDSELLRQARNQLEAMFLLVFVGEFNSGKSAVINALIGEEVMPEGVTPTTSMIHLLMEGDAGRDAEFLGGVFTHRHPSPFLREISVVDTPGTNAIIREHEAISQDFIPRSDLVLFVTSADRPFSESEREFLSHIRTWRKKVVFVLNKIDLFEEESQLRDVLDFVSENVQRLLGFEPLIFPVSARLADRSDPASRMDALRSYIMDTLDEEERIKLKLLNPVGVAERLLSRDRDVVESRLTLLDRDSDTINRIEAYLTGHENEVRNEFRNYISRVENLIHRLNERADRFFDEYVRLGRVFDLMQSDGTRKAFERDVVADTERQVDATISELIDWLVSQDLRAWQVVSETLDRQALERYREDMVGQVGVNFANDRQALILQVTREANAVIDRYDQHSQAEFLASSVKSALAQTALAGAGAISVGAIVVALATTAAADVTGILAAATVAGLGLFILPARKSAARSELRRRSGELQRQLTDVLEDGFERELTRSVRRIKDAIAPYTRFVGSERLRLTALRADVDAALNDSRGLRAAIN